MSFQVFVAATVEDWTNLFERTNENEKLRFYRMVAFGEDGLIPFGVSDFRDLVSIKYGILVQEEAFLALPSDQDPVVREVRQSNGAVRYVVDQLQNPDSFVFRPGGAYQDKYFVIGEISSINGGVTAEIAKRLRASMRKTFNYTGTYWMGGNCATTYSNREFTFDYRYPTRWSC